MELKAERSKVKGNIVYCVVVFVVSIVSWAEGPRF
jgi:hypothetical protein